MLRMKMRAMLRDVAYDIVCDAARDVTWTLLNLSPISFTRKLKQR